MSQSLWKMIWQVLIKLNMHLPYDPNISLLGIYKETVVLYVHTVEHYSAIKRSKLLIHATMGMNSKNITAELKNPDPKKEYIWIFSYKVLEHVELLQSDRKQISGCLALGEGGMACRGE